MLYKVENNILQQKCTVKKIIKNNSGCTLYLEPKKQPCPGCNGKCSRMLKKSELIEINYNKQDLRLEQEVMVILSKIDLIKMVIFILGLPLVVLVLIVFTGSVLNIKEYLTVLVTFLSLSLTFFIQIKLIKAKNVFKIVKYQE